MMSVMVEAVEQKPDGGVSSIEYEEVFLSSMRSRDSPSLDMVRVR